MGFILRFVRRKLFMAQEALESLFAHLAKTNVERIDKAALCTVTARKSKLASENFGLNGLDNYLGLNGLGKISSELFFEKLTT